MRASGVIQNLYLLECYSIQDGLGSSLGCCDWEARSSAMQVTFVGFHLSKVLLAHPQ
jgi:hypothetical protein